MNKWMIRSVLALAVILVIGLMMGMAVRTGESTSVIFELLPFRDTSHSVAVSAVIKPDEHAAWQLDARAYIKSDNWRHPEGLKKDLRVLDSLYPDHYRNIEVLCAAITKENNFWQSSDPDSLNQLLNWAVALNCTEEGESEYRLLFLATYNYWMNELSARLNALAKKDRNIRYTFKFKYLRERCRQLLFGVDVTDDSMTKIVNNVVERKWHYLIVERLWGATGWPFRLLLLLIAGVTVWGYSLILKKIIKTVWKN